MTKALRFSINKTNLQLFEPASAKAVLPAFVKGSRVKVFHSREDRWELHIKADRGSNGSKLDKFTNRMAVGRENVEGLSDFLKVLELTHAEYEAPGLVKMNTDFTWVFEEDTLKLRFSISELVMLSPQKDYKRKVGTLHIETRNSPTPKDASKITVKAVEPPPVKLKLLPVVQDESELNEAVATVNYYMDKYGLAVKMIKGFNRIKLVKEYKG